MRGCLRVLLGLILALGLLGAGAYALGKYLIDRFDTAPPKPIFPEEQGKAFSPLQTRPSATPTPTPKPSVTPAKPGQPSPNPAKPTVTPSPTAKPTPAGDPGYVTWPEGLLVRGQPSFDSAGVGGVGYNAEVYIVEESPDKVWLRIRTKDGKLDGWVKNGNVAKGTAPAAPPDAPLGAPLGAPPGAPGLEPPADVPLDSEPLPPVDEPIQ